MCTVLAHAANEVMQTFPKNDSYCCHCPNIALKCTFSEVPLIAFWTMNGDEVRVTDNTPGHIVNAVNGSLILEVIRSNYSRNNRYLCNAEYINETVKSDPFDVPEAEG